MPSRQPEAPELIWLLPEHSGRGPRPAHSRASIAAAAVRIADAEGLDAVSMRKVAAELGAGTMSLYNYVPKKEHLFDLMVDQIAGEYELPTEPSGDWRADLTALAGRQLAVLRRHGWAARLIATRPSLGPNGLRYTEHFLGALAGTELTGSAKMEAMSQLNGFLCQFAEWERSATGSSPRWISDMVTYLQGVAMSGGYPRLAQVLAEGPAPSGPDAVFDRLLQRILTAICET
ncbi:TetR/AcrR family transcriptional regulator [Kitasatospora sp. NPDC056138]|uniref:TetR/AcrR family transcriptional regulator n=1 Tax=Kitasatospora sp. NPDC056138 TaxID=3345724 RepID=UPI0035E1DBC3